MFFQKCTCSCCIILILDYHLHYRSYIRSTFNLAFHRHTNGPTRRVGQKYLHIDVDGWAGVDVIPTGKHYSAMPAWALLNSDITKGAFLWDDPDQD